MQKKHSSKAHLKNLRLPHVALLVAPLLLILGIFFVARMNKINSITSDITVEPGSILGLSNVSWFDQSDKKAMQPPAAGQKYITVSLGVTNRSTTEQWATPVTQSYVIDSADQHHGLELVVSDNPFQAGPINAGGLLVGDVSYMVPSNDPNLRLCYQLDGSGTAPACISLNEYNRK